MRTKGIVIAAAIAVLAASGANAQDRAQDNKSKQDEIIVEGLTLKGTELPTMVFPGTSNGLSNRKDFEFAQRLAECAVRLPRRRLRDVIDGEIYTPAHRLAQNWIIQRAATCHMSTEVREASMRRSADSSQPGVHAKTDADAFAAQGVSKYFDQSVTGVSIYDRGAILEQVLDKFVPDLALTGEQTGNATVQSRFNATEIPRNRFRLDEDYRYFAATVCMVRMEPELSVRLIRAKGGSKQQATLQTIILNRTRACIGNPKKVRVDSTQFRIYIMDAVYRWVAASRGVTSLIPNDAS